MKTKLLNKLSLCVFIACYSLTTVGSTATPNTPSAAASSSSSLWHALGKKMSLTAYGNNQQVQKKIKWYMAHQDVLQEFSQNAQPYIFYVSQQVEKNR